MRPAAILRLLALIGLASLSLAAQAGNVVLDSTANSINPVPHTELLRDDAGTLTLDDVRMPGVAAGFEPSNSNAINLGFVDDVYWYRLVVQNPTTAATGKGSEDEWVVEVGYTVTNTLDLYVVREDGTVETHLAGNRRPDAPNQIASRHFAFPLALHPGERAVLYLRQQSDGTQQMELTLWPAAAYASKVATDGFWLGLYYGIMAVMALYNLFILLAVRDIAYLYYVGYIVCVAALNFLLNGLARRYLGGDWPAIAFYALPALILLPTLFASLFSQKFLEARRNVPRWHKAFTGLTVVTALGLCAIPFVPLSTAVQPSAAIAALLPFVAVGAGLTAVLKGVRIARLYLIAWATLMGGVLLIVLESAAIIPVSAVSSYGMQFGSVLDVTLLSLALADRINIERREKDVAREVALDSQRQMEVAKASTQAKSQFLATISHELRTPMNAIIGFTGLARRSRDEERRNSYLDQISDSSSSLLSLLNDILDLSKIEAGKLSLEAMPFRLSPLLSKVDGMFSAQAQAKGLKLAMSPLPKNLPVLVGDALRLEQVLVNLLGNAIKFTENGKVELSVECKSQPNGQLQLSFAVTDSGIGMSEEQLKRLFQAFTQADNSTTRKYGGTGLGLSISRQIIEMMGGTLQAQSTEGRGSRFYFTLDLDIAEARHQSDSVPATTGKRLTALDGLRVLLAEDNAVNRRLVKEILGDAGVVMTFAEDGGLAVEAMQSGQIDIVLMDMHMPVMGGLEATRKIRNLPGCAHIPIIAMTASAMEQDREECLGAGMNDFLPKPFDAERLLEMLAYWMQPRTEAYPANPA